MGREDKDYGQAVKEKLEEQPVGDSGPIKGIDVSRWQKGIDWKAVAADGVQFAFLKATDGANGVDPEYQNHRKAAKAAGLLVGGYHYFRFEQDIPQQAVNFMRTLGDIRGELPPVVDVEWDRYSSHYSEGHTMDDEAADRVAVFISILAHSMRGLPIIYTNYYFWNMGKRDSSFENSPLWVPNYKAKTIAEVKIPQPWKRAAFWQYSESIKKYGVDAVDGDWFLGSMAELKAMVRQ